MFYLQMIEFTFFSWTLMLFLMLMHSTLRPTSPLFWPLLNRMCHKTTSHVEIWAVTFLFFLSFFSVYFMFCLFACANDVFPVFIAIWVIFLFACFFSFTQYGRKLYQDKNRFHRCYVYLNQKGCSRVDSVIVVLLVSFNTWKHLGLSSSWSSN